MKPSQMLLGASRKQPWAGSAWLSGRSQGIPAYFGVYFLPSIPQNDLGEKSHLCNGLSTWALSMIRSGDQSQAWWHTPVMSALGRERQEDQEFEVIHAYV